MARVQTTITVRKDKDNGTWSYRVEQSVDGVYAGIVSWGNTDSRSYMDLKKKADHWLPTLEEMAHHKCDNYWVWVA